jgi:hypothetical protein
MYWSPSRIISKGLCLAFLSLGMVVSSCQSSQNGEGKQPSIPVASVGEDTLYQRDVEQYYQGIAQKANDSQALVNNYIDRWINQKIVFQKAMNELPKPQKDKSEALQRYYESLIRHTFKSKLFRTKLDRNISADTLKSYYKAHKTQFKLKEPICKVRYMALPLSAPRQEAVSKWFRSDKNYHLDSLFKYANKHARHFSLNAKEWYYLKDLKKRFDLKGHGQDLLANQSLYHKQIDSTTKLHLDFQKHQMAGTTAPFSLVADQIRQRFLNDRKQALIKRMEQAAIRKAKQQDKVKRYE